MEGLIAQIVGAAVKTATNLLGDRVKAINKDLEKNKKQRKKQKNSSKARQAISGELQSHLKTIDREETLGQKVNSPLRDGMSSLYSASDSIPRIDARLLIDQEEVIDSIKNHLGQIRDWSERVKFKELQKSRNLSSVYIPLDTYLIPRETHICVSEREDKINLLEELVRSSQHTLILGAPGAGKTTSVKKVVSHWLSAECLSDKRLLILVRFRALSHNKSPYPLRDALREIINFDVGNIDQVPVQYVNRLLNDALVALLDSMNVTLILEGFDEIADSETKQNVLSELRYLIERIECARIVITCRTGEFPYDIDKMSAFEIAPLDSHQIDDFSAKWLGEKSEKFLDQVKNSPYYDSAMRPLSLAHLCAIYERIGRIPEKPKTIYKKIVGLLLEEWDEQRSINRVSICGHFETDRKYEFLCHLAYELTAKGIRGEFSESQLYETYRKISREYGLSESLTERKTIIREVESQTGLFLRSGYESFEFAHKSLQEYLTAEYLVKLPTLQTIPELIENLGAELAIATSISSNPSMYFSDLVLGAFPKSRMKKTFYDAFINRLLVEKPSFTPTEDLALAMLYMFSDGVRDHYSDSSFIELCDKLLKKGDYLVLLKYYRHRRTDTEHRSVEVEKKLDHKIYKLRNRLKFFDQYALIRDIFNNRQ